jgi:hypothetical protein
LLLLLLLLLLLVHLCLGSVLFHLVLLDKVCGGLCPSNSCCF